MRRCACQQVGARQAGPPLAAVGPEDFQESVRLWFAPFRSGTPLPLSVAGSHVLKCLIWYCAVARDEELKGCALWLFNVKWRQKRNSEKSMVALAEFGITKEELRARNLIKPPVPDPMPRWIEKVCQAVCRMSDRHIVIDSAEDLVIVQGQLQFYRLFRAPGRIERAIDNAELEVNWPAVPDQLRLVLHRECNSEQQFELRALLLMNEQCLANIPKKRRRSVSSRRQFGRIIVDSYAGH